MLVRWLALAPHTTKVLSSNPGWTFFACRFFSVNSGVLLEFMACMALGSFVILNWTATCLRDVPGFSIYDSCDRLISAVTLDILTWDPKTTYLVLESASSGQRRNCSFGIWALATKGGLDGSKPITPNIYTIDTNAGIDIGLIVVRYDLYFVSILEVQM